MKKSFDMVIMNPPFTDNIKRGSRMPDGEKRAMQFREHSIADSVRHAVGGCIDFNSISTFFIPIADGMVSSDAGSTLAAIQPTSAFMGLSGLGNRRFLARNLQIEKIITAHDPKQINYSHDTTINESLFIARRHPLGTTQPVEFVSVGRNKIDSTVIKQAMIPADIVRSGDWSAVQWYDNTLWQAAQEIHQSGCRQGILVELQDRYALYPDGRMIRNYFKRDDAGKALIFWNCRGSTRNVMDTLPEALVSPMKRNADDLLTQGSNLLLSSRCNINCNPLISVFTDTPAISASCMPIQVDNKEHAKALCAFFNSTIGLILFLNRRSKKLSYPKITVGYMKTMPVPNFKDGISHKPLLDAFHQTRDVVFKKMMHIPDDDARQVLDKAAADTLGIPYEWVEEWGRLLAAEPSVCNESAS